MQTLWQDIRYGARMFIKNPGFTFIALISLALGIGANTAIFSLVNTVLFRPFPVQNPQQLYALTVQSKDGTPGTLSYPDYIDFRDRAEVMNGLFATRMAPMSLSNNGNNERLWGFLVTGNYFNVLGVQAKQGRVFTADDDRTRLGHPIAVLSHTCWQKRFGGDPNIVGKTILLNSHSFEVIGITPEGFAGTDLIYSPEIWVPMMMQPWIEPENNWLDRRATHNIFATGRLKQGVSKEQAETALNQIAQQLGEEYPNDDEGLSIGLMKPGFIIPSIQNAFISFSTILLAVVALVLLIACTNLASLMLARATKRRKEIAVRLAIGASRWVLIRQLLTESLLLSVVGGAMGLLLALWLLDFVAAVKPQIDIPLTLELHLDWRVLAFSLLISLLTSTLFGLVPALQATKPDIVPTLKDETTIGGFRRSRLRSALVVAQLSLSLLLLVAAGLVLRSLQHLQTMNPGFTVKNGLLVSFDLGLQGYDKTRGEQFQKQIIERVSSLPGVQSAALTDLFPLSINYSSNGVFIEGHPPLRGTDVPNAMVASVSSDYFKTMEIPMLAGRAFTQQDDAKATQAAIVNEAFIRKLMPELKSLDEAIGKRFSYRGVDGPFMQIIGVARDGKYWTIGEASQPFSYTPMLQSYSSSTTMVIRTTVEPRSLLTSVQREFQSLDETLPVYGSKTLDEHLGISLFPTRVAAMLLGSFGGIALILAAIGIYGVMAYSVAQRTREIGIRMALGAQTSDVLAMILKQGARLVSIGLVIGLLASFALTNFMSSVLYGVSATDLWTFAIVSAALIGVALGACFLPARRAAKTNPIIALRYE